MVAVTDGMRQECDGSVVYPEERLFSAQALLSKVSSKVSVGVPPRLMPIWNGHKKKSLPNQPLIYKSDINTRCEHMQLCQGKAFTKQHTTLNYFLYKNNVTFCEDGQASYS